MTKYVTIFKLLFFLNIEGNKPRRHDDFNAYTPQEQTKFKCNTKYI